MKPFLFISFVLVHLGFFSRAQDGGNDKMEVRAVNRQVIIRKDTIYRFYARIPDQPIRTRTDRTYYWYKSDTILATAGGYDGRLLDGHFTVFYPEKNLREEGDFKDGLRTGEWRNWYPGGKIRSVFYWKGGRKNGLFKEYDTGGKTVREGHYKNDNLSGEIIEYNSDGRPHKVKYKDGALQVPEGKKDAEEQKTPKEKKQTDHNHAG